MSKVETQPTDNSVDSPAFTGHFPRNRNDFRQGDHGIDRWRGWRECPHPMMWAWSAVY